MRCSATAAHRHDNVDIISTLDTVFLTTSNYLSIHHGKYSKQLTQWMYNMFMNEHSKRNNMSSAETRQQTVVLVVRCVCVVVYILHSVMYTYIIVNLFIRRYINCRVYLVVYAAV